MTFDELEAALPNGLHDAQLKAISLDYQRRQVTLDLDLWVGDLDAATETEREAMRPARITLKDVAYCVVEAPDGRYPFAEDGAVWIDSGPGQPAGNRTTLPALPEGYFRHYLFAHDRNCFVHLAAKTAAVAWRDGSAWLDSLRSAEDVERTSGPSAEALLRRAANLLPSSDRDASRWALLERCLADRSPERAVDLLEDLGTAVGAGGAFWAALRETARALGLRERFADYRFRENEAKRGYILARLRVTPTDEGGRQGPFFSDYRPNWDIGIREHESTVFTDAIVTIEGKRSLAPGEEGLVRIHPLAPEFWRNIRPGAALGMHEGQKLVGRAVVVALVPPAVPRP